MSAPQPDEIPAADGRLPGRRGQATRLKLLDATAQMLETTSWRELKVVDIARRAGTSPATFYQYFPDVQAAILLLAKEMSDQGALLAEAAHGSWSGKGAFDSAGLLVDSFLRFWEEHEAVLRVVDLAIVEGDRRFREIRNHLLNPVTLALSEEIGEQKDAGRHPDELDPRAQASVLVSMLAHVAEHRHGLETWGVRTNAARDSMARIITWSVTGRRPQG